MSASELNDLPPLPKADIGNHGTFGSWEAWSAHSMRAYARAAIEADRQKRAVDADMLRDAERYRWLRDLKPKHFPPVSGAMWVVQYHQLRGVPPETRSAGFGEDLDAAIDASRLKGEVK